MIQFLTPVTNIAGILGGLLLIVTLGMVQTGLIARQMTHLMNLQMFRNSVLGGAPIVSGEVRFTFIILKRKG